MPLVFGLEGFKKQIGLNSPKLLGNFLRLRFLSMIPHLFLSLKLELSVDAYKWSIKLGSSWLTTYNSCGAPITWSLEKKKFLKSHEALKPSPKSFPFLSLPFPSSIVPLKTETTNAPKWRIFAKVEPLNKMQILLDLFIEMKCTTKTVTGKGLQNLVSPNKEMAPPDLFV